MISRLVSGSVPALVASFLGAACSPASAAGLEALRGKAEPVLVFAPRHADKRTIEQLQNLKAGADRLFERDMPVFVVTGSDAAALVHVGADIRPQGADLRRAYGVGDDDFAVVVVGRDGGEKLKSSTPVSADRLAGVTGEARNGSEAPKAATANAR